MKQIGTIFCRDLRALVTHGLALLVAVVLTLMPSLYAWVNIYANWDPYGNIDQLPVAIVSQDTGYTDASGNDTNEGQKLVDSLQEKAAIHWVSVSDADEAMQGVQSGRYYAAVVIGADFSRQLHDLTQWQDRPTITYYENGKKNAVAVKITDTAVETLQQQISRSYLDVLIETVFQEAGTLSQKLEQADPQGSLVALLEESDALLHACSDALNAFSSANEGGTTLSLPDDLSLPDGETLTSTAALNQQMYETLSQVERALQQVVSAAENGGSITLPDDAIAAVEKTADKLHDWSEKASSLGADHAAQQVQALAERFDSLSAELKELPTLSDGKEVLSDAAKDVLALVQTLRTQVSDTLIPTQTALTEQLQQALSALQGNLDGLQGPAADVAALLSQMEVLLQSADGSMEKLQTLTDQTAERMDTLLERLEAHQTDTLTELLGHDSAAYGAYFSSVVQTESEEIYPVDNYGSAMAPFYTTLAIWVGGVMLVAVIKTNARREETLHATSAQLFFARYLLFLLLSQIQAAVIIAGDLWVLHIQCLHPARLFLTGALISLTFSLLIYALTVSFNYVGKAIVVVVMVLQIAGSSGTFPIELLPELYQRIYHLFPFPYAIDAMRECVCGMYGSYWAENIGKLLIFAAAALCLGLTGRNTFRGINAFVEEKLEQTELL